MTSFKTLPWMVGALLCLGLSNCKCKKSDSAPTEGVQGVQPGLGAVDPARRNPNNDGRQRVMMQPEWTTCSNHEQCIHIPVDCCGCVGGGADVAAVVAAMEPMAKAREAMCGGSLCAAVMGTDPSCGATSKCVNGRCSLVNAQGVGLERTVMGVRVEDIRMKQGAHIPDNVVPALPNNP